MNARLASFGDGIDRRLILAINVFRWNLRLGLAIAPREMAEPRRRRRRRTRLSEVPPYLRADIGLPPEEETIPLHVYAFQRLLMR